MFAKIWERLHFLVCNWIVPDWLFRAITCGYGREKHLQRGSLSCAAGNSIGMLLAPCCYSDGYGVRPTLGTMDYSRTMQVYSDALKCVRDSDDDCQVPSY